MTKPIIILISADAEWVAVLKEIELINCKSSPYGDWFIWSNNQDAIKTQVIFFHGGWGKVNSAGSTQYAIDRWKPELIINIGTCGGFEGEINTSDVVLVEETVIYDIYEKMGDADEHIKEYRTKINLDWLGNEFPFDVIRSIIVSGDKDLEPKEIGYLKDKYSAIVGDWESGSIAHVSQSNNVKVLILRGVTDLVSSSEGELYGDIQMFQQRTNRVMKQLIEQLPEWIKLAIHQLGT